MNIHSQALRKYLIILNDNQYKNIVQTHESDKGNHVRRILGGQLLSMASKHDAYELRQAGN